MKPRKSVAHAEALTLVHLDEIPWEPEAPLVTPEYQRAQVAA
jgi:hypothetical protein